MKYLIAIVLVLTSTAAFGVDETGLAAILDETRPELDAEGLRATILYPNGRMVSAAVGLADREANLPLDNTIGMPGGSTGKTFAAALVMVLVEDGVMALDDPAMKWLGDTSWFPDLPNAETIQVRHLLSHSAGLGDYPGSIRFNLGMVWRVIRRGSAYFTPEELISRAKTDKPLFAPGEGFAYTDAGYLVLGRALEAASGGEYFDLLSRRILDPLELNDVRPQNVTALPNIAAGYQGGARNLKDDGRMKFDPRSEWTGGGLVTTPQMLARFYAALANGEVVSPAGFEQMVNGGWRDPNTPDRGYGFGLFVEEHGKLVSHGGMWVGYRSHVIHDREQNITVATQINRDGRVDLEGFTRRLLELATTNRG